MNKPRVVALTTSYPLRPGACAGLFIQNLYRRLSVWYAIDVVCPADAVALPVTDDAGADIRVQAVRYAPRRWRVLAQQAGGVVPSLKRAPWRVLMLPALLVGLFWRCLERSSDADLIHANWALCGMVAGVVGRLRRKPVITTLRGDDVARASRSSLDRAILAQAVRHSRILVCVSTAMAEQLRASFPARASDIHACLNGVNEAFFRVQRTSARDGALHVLAAGSLIHRKGFDVLVEAVARSHGRKHIRVTVIGEGPERAALLALANARNVSDRFDFVGEVPAADMPKRFATADLFVLPSRSEGRPNVVIEALASGLPVICTDLDGVRDMVESGDNGWLVHIDDANELASALDQAAVNADERLRRGARARQLARLNIGSWADTARCYDVLMKAMFETDRKVRASCAE